MSFDLYNKNTWEDLKPIDPRIKLLNKIKGAISNKIPMARDLKEKLLKESGANNDEAVITIARDLEQCNKKAFDIMEIKFEFSNQNILFILKDADIVLDTWSDIDTRDVNAEALIPCLHRIEEFGKSKDNFSTIKVEGNEAWREYLKLKLENIDFNKKYLKLMLKNNKNDSAGHLNWGDGDDY